MAAKLPRCPRCGHGRDGSPAPDRAAGPSDPESYRVSISISSDGSPWNYLILGVVVAMVGGVVLAFSDGPLALLVGCAAVGVGSLVATIGTVAVGVELGMSAAANSVRSVRVTRE